MNMQNKQFYPPIVSYDVVSYDADKRSSASLLLRDAAGSLFALHVQTLDSFGVEARLQVGVPDAVEPVVCVPENHVDQGVIETVLSLDAALLMRFLVPQDEV